MDDLNKAGTDTLDIISDMLSASLQNKKIIVITQTLMDAEILLFRVDAVVRLRQDITEILFSALKSIDNL